MCKGTCTCTAFIIHLWWGCLGKVVNKRDPFSGHYLYPPPSPAATHFADTFGLLEVKNAILITWRSRVPMMVHRTIMIFKWAVKAIFHHWTTEKKHFSLTASLTVLWLLLCIQLVPIKLQNCTNCIGLTSTISRRDCMEFTQMFHSSELGLMNKLQPKEELHSAPRMSSQSKNCTQKYILLVFQHLSICHLR